MSKDGPYHDVKVYHLAHLFSAKGVSAICYERPRAIPVGRRGQSWTITPSAVTCRKCLKKMAAAQPSAGREREEPPHAS